MCGKSPEKKKKKVTNKQTHTLTVNMTTLLVVILYDIHVTKKPKICDKLNIALFTCKLLHTFAC